MGKLQRVVFRNMSAGLPGRAGRKTSMLASSAIPALVLAGMAAAPAPVRAQSQSCISTPSASGRNYMLVCQGGNGGTGFEGSTGHTARMGGRGNTPSFDSFTLTGDYTGIGGQSAIIIHGFGGTAGQVQFSDYQFSPLPNPTFGFMLAVNGNVLTVTPQLNNSSQLGVSLTPNQAATADHLSAAFEGICQKAPTADKYKQLLDEIGGHTLGKTALRPSVRGGAVYERQNDWVHHASLAHARIDLGSYMSQIELPDWSGAAATGLDAYAGEGLTLRLEYSGELNSDNNAHSATLKRGCRFCWIPVRRRGQATEPLNETVHTPLKSRIS